MPEASWAESIVNVDISSFEGLAIRLHAINHRILFMAEAYEEIKHYFGEMERVRFAGKGAAPEYGINSQWAPLADSTVQKKALNLYALGWSSDILIEYGFLSAAAMDPKLDFTSNKMMLVIDPRNKGAHASDNYGQYHQHGEGVPTREVVTITPVVYVEVGRIVKNWLLHLQPAERTAIHQANVQAAQVKRNMFSKSRQAFTRGVQRGRAIAVSAGTAAAGVAKGFASKIKGGLGRFRRG